MFRTDGDIGPYFDNVISKLQYTIPCVRSTCLYASSAVGPECTRAVQLSQRDVAANVQRVLFSGTDCCALKAAAARPDPCNYVPTQPRVLCRRSAAQKHGNYTCSPLLPRLTHCPCSLRQLALLLLRWQSPGQSIACTLISSCRWSRTGCTVSIARLMLSVACKLSQLALQLPRRRTDLPAGMLGMYDH